MPRPRNADNRISEPYFERDRKRWRVIVRGGEGETGRFAFKTEREARAFVQSSREEIEDKSMTVEDALDDYQQYRSKKGLMASSIETTGYRLRGLLAALLKQNVHKVTANKEKVCFNAYDNAPTTRRSALRELKGFVKWCKSEKLTSTDFSEGIIFEGKIAKGKPQLRRSSARLFSSKALELFNEGNEAGLAVLMALGLGLRTGEVMDRIVSDIDDDCQLLWVTKSKSEAGIRQVEIPPMLGSLLRKQIEGKKQTERVFAHQGEHYVNDWSKKICRMVGIPEVTGQGLRGTFATLAVSQGIAPMVVAQTLGHADSAVTLAHYAIPGSEQTGGAKKMEKLIQNESNIQTHSRPNGATVPN